MLGKIARKISGLFGGPHAPVCRVKELDLNTQDFSGYLQDLFDKQNDCLLIKGAIPNELLTNIGTLAQTTTQQTVEAINTGDGVVYPAPYSMVHNNIADPEAMLDGYFTQAEQALQNNGAFFGEPLANRMKSVLANVLGHDAKLLKYGDGRAFSTINTRVLFAQKSGIDIHCENAFLHQLQAQFRENLYQQVDIENAISYFFVLQAPDEGGELVVFDKVWDTTPIELSTISYEARHDINGSMFVAAGKGKARHQMIKPQAGDLVVFRAAQIWHSINALKSNTARITAGGFFAKSVSGQGIQYWA